MSNKTIEVLMNRYSCRNFSPDPIKEGDLELIVKAGLAAPSGMNRQPWRLTVLKDKRLMSEIEEAGINHLKDDPAAYDRIMGRGGKLFYNAPMMIFIPGAKGSELDCGIICENIVIAAESLGISTLICGLARLAFLSDKGDYFREKLCFPKDYDFATSILLGYSNTANAKPHELDMTKVITVG